MGSEDGLVNFAGDENLFVVEEGADDDVSIVKPQVGALVSLYFVARLAFVYPWPLGGKKGICWGRHGVCETSRFGCAYYMRPNKKRSFLLFPIPSGPVSLLSQSRSSSVIHVSLSPFVFTGRSQ